MIFATKQFITRSSGKFLSAEWSSATTWRSAIWSRAFSAHAFREVRCRSVQMAGSLVLSESDALKKIFGECSSCLFSYSRMHEESDLIPLFSTTKTLFLSELQVRLHRMPPAICLRLSTTLESPLMIKRQSAISLWMTSESSSILSDRFLFTRLIIMLVQK